MTKVYAGDRTIDGIVVTVNDEPLATHADSKLFARTGFEWSYEGPEPAQLAYAILVDHLGDTRRAAELQKSFMHTVIANLPNEWELSSADIDRVLQGLQ